MEDFNEFQEIISNILVKYETELVTVYLTEIVNHNFKLEKYLYDEVLDIGTVKVLKEIAAASDIDHERIPQSIVKGIHTILENIFKPIDQNLDALLEELYVEMEESEEIPKNDSILCKLRIWASQKRIIV